MRKSNSFKFTLRSDEREPVIYLGEHRSPKLLFRILRGGRPAREIPIRERDSAGVYRYLLGLIQKRGLPLNSFETLPTALEPSIRELTRRDSQESVALGEGPAGERIELDLISYPHAFIGGGTGSGKTVALETIFDQAVLSKDVELWVADGLSVDFGRYPLREQDRYAHRPEEFAEMLQDLLIEARARKQKLEDESKRSYLELQDSPRAIFLGISEAVRFFGKQEGLLESDRMLLEEIYSLFAELLRMSSGLGIHIFLESARFRLSENLDALIPKFPNRILVGRGDERTQFLVLGDPSSFPSRLLEPRGRAVLALEGTQQLFQTYRVPRRLLLSEVGTRRNPYNYGNE